jgi:hypothetical protein
VLILAAVFQPTATLADSADPTTIGYSQGGRPLTVYHLGDGPQTVLILGGQHGAPEVNTVRLAERLLAYFEDNPNEIPDRLRLDFILQANPDGVAHGSRQFLSGVDPNRNWDSPDWMGDAFDSNGLFRFGLGGEEPFSEPETQELRDYVLDIRPVLVINYHSRGGFIFGGRARDLAEIYASASGYFVPLPSPGGGGGGPSLLGYRATGSMNVWLSSEEIPAMLIELATSSDPEFARNLAGLRAVLPVLVTPDS